MENFKLSELTRANFSKAVSGIYLETDYNNKQYPEYTKWFYSKNIPRVQKGDGDIIILQDKFNTAGIAIVKNTKREKKICTLFIDEEYRKRGYSKELVEKCFEILETDKPVITIPENKLFMFKDIVNAYDWKLTKCTDEYYSKELIFNE